MPPVLQASVQLGTITVGGCTGVKTIMAEGDIPVVKLLGELEVGIGGQACALPASRKCRALLVWLVLNPRRQRREALCDLLWSGTDDPRAGLRWSLSKVRGILGDGLQADRDTVALDAEAFTSDLAELERQLQTDSPDRDLLGNAAAELALGYLPGIDCAGNPRFEQWLETERNRFRQLHLDTLQSLQESCDQGSSEALALARRRVAVDSLDTHANLDLCGILLSQEGIASARKQLEKARSQLQEEQLDDSELLAGWRRLCGHSKQAGPVIETTIPEPEFDLHAPELPRKPSLAVLGFEEIGEPSVLSVGLTADLISRLSRLAGLFVIARASSTRFNAAAGTHADIGRSLGVRYLVQGTVQQLGKRLRLQVELIEAEGGEQLWSERFDRSLDDLFSLQDELAGAIVSAVEPEIERAEYHRAALKPPDSLDAWESFHMALWHSYRFTAEDTERARDFLDRALAQDPDFSRAHAAMSLVHFSRAFLNASDDINDDIARSLASAETSVGLNDRDAMGHWSLGRAQLMLREHDMAMESLDRALLVNPNYAQGHYAKGYVGFHAGRDISIIHELDMARRLSPFDPMLFAISSARALSMVVNGQTEEAVSWALRATLQANAHFHIFAIAAICLELSGRHEEGLLQLARAYERHPGYTREVFFRSFPHKDQTRQWILENALIRLGMP